MNCWLRCVTILMLAVYGGAGCSPPSDSANNEPVPSTEAVSQTMTEPGDTTGAERLEQVVETAREDLAQSQDLDPAMIEVASARAVTWRSGALGCPAPDLSYTQALVPGYQVVLLAQGGRYTYHASAGGKPFLCPPERIQSAVSAGPGKSN